MTKKDYEMVAAIFRSEYSYASPDKEAFLNQLRYKFEVAFNADNPRFLPAKFREKCREKSGI